MVVRRGAPRMYLRGGRWWADLRGYAAYGGRREPLIVEGERLATTQEDLARDLLQTRVAELEGLQHRKHFTGRGAPVDPRQLVARMILAMEAAGKRSAGYIARLEVDVTRVLDKTSLVEIEDITDLDTSAVTAALLEMTEWTGRNGAATQSTRRRYAMALSSLAEFAVEEGLLVSNPVQRSRALPAQQDEEPREALEPADVGRLLKRAAQGMRNGHLSPYFFERVATLAYTGARLRECLRLNVADFDFATDRVLFRKHVRAPKKDNRGKTPDALTIARVVRMWPHLREIMEASFRDHPRSGELAFPSFKRGPGGEERRINEMHAPLVRLGEELGLPIHTTPHILRHSFASARLTMSEIDGAGHRVAVSTRTVANELGHTSTRLVEQRYGHVLHGRMRDSVVLDYRTA